MNTAQALTAKSFARHCLQYAQPFVSAMKSHTEANPGDFADVTPEQFMEIVDMEFEHMIKEIKQVFTDMSGDFNV